METRTPEGGASFVNGQDLVVDGGFLETPLMHAQPPADQYGGHGR